MTAAMTTMERMKEAGMGPATLVNLICDICAFWMCDLHTSTCPSFAVL